MSEQFPPVLIPRTEVRRLFSSIVQQEYHIFVALPEDGSDSKKTYPVLYILDAKAMFGCVTEIVRLMQVLDELPNMMIVGIAYPVDTYKETLGLRARDFTPTINESWFTEVAKTRPYITNHGTGGAGKFLQFIRDELIPFIEANYPADNQDRTVAGGSFSGLFALYALLRHPDTFDRYIAVSPSLWWDDGVLFKFESEFTQNKSQLPAKVFISMGALEDESSIEDMKRFTDILRERAYEGLELRTCIFEDETHLSAVAGALSRGIRVVYG
jgi:predicted alpha/beta superfamily hydrolase